MNIFFLDYDVEKCAQYHVDKHVVKMILESAQMLCTVVWLYGNYAPYRPTHVKHPCTIWLTESTANWQWLIRLNIALNQEFKHRFSHTVNHKSFDVITTLTMPKLPNCIRTPFAQVMPEQYMISTSPVQAYRRFYLAEKSSFCQWTNRKIPFWFKI